MPRSFPNMLIRIVLGAVLLACAFAIDRWGVNTRLIFPVAGAIFLVWVILKVGITTTERRRLMRLRRGLCPACGYDIRVTPERCPECGFTSNSSVERSSD